MTAFPPWRDRDSLDESRDPGGEIGRLLVAAFLGQPAVARDVEEADRRRTLERRVQTGPDQDALEPFEDVAHPGVGLLAMEEREHRVVGDGSCVCRESLGPRPDLGGRDAGSEQRLEDLGPPPVRLGLGHASHAVAGHTQAPFDRGRLDPGREEGLEIRDDPHLVLP